MACFGATRDNARQLTATALRALDPARGPLSDDG